MSNPVQLLAALGFLATGISHFLNPHAWVTFFAALRERDEGVFLNAGYHFLVGAFFVTQHRASTAAGVVLTVLAWALMLKGALYLARPALGRRSMGLVTLENAGAFRIAGALMTALGLWLGWDAWTAQPPA